MNQTTNTAASTYPIENYQITNITLALKILLVFYEYPVNI